MYEELVSYWLDGKYKWDKYKDDIQCYATGIRNYFLKQLNIGDAHYLKMFNPKDTDTSVIEKESYPLEKKVDLSDDGWGKIGMRLLLERDKVTFPKDQYLFTIKIKIVGKKWFVKLSETSIEHSFDVYERNDQNNYSQLWEEFVKYFREQTLNDFDNWLSRKGQTTTIGFIKQLDKI